MSDIPTWSEIAKMAVMGIGVLIGFPLMIFLIFGVLSLFVKDGNDGQS